MHTIYIYVKIACYLQIILINGNKNHGNRRSPWFRLRNIVKKSPDETYLLRVTLTKKEKDKVAQMYEWHSRRNRKGNKQETYANVKCWLWYKPNGSILMYVIMLVIIMVRNDCYRMYIVLHIQGCRLSPENILNENLKLFPFESYLRELLGR